MILENGDTYGYLRLLLLVLAAALVFGAVCVGGVSGADMWDGTVDTSWYSSSQTTFTITTSEQLAGLAELVNRDRNQVTFEGKTIYLGADLDMSGHEWTSIGYKDSSSRSFKGTFNGNGHTISGLTQSLDKNEEGGLFGYVSGGTITGVTLTDSTFTLTSRGITLGSLVGILEDGNVNNCDVSNVYITSTFDWNSDFWNALITLFIGSHTVGGAVGLNDGGVVSGYDINVSVEEKLQNSWFNSGSCKFGEIVGDGGYLNAPQHYTISITVGEHGSASPGTDIVYLPGESGTYVFTPDIGYAVDKILVDGLDKTANIISGDPRSPQSYTFADINQNHEISVTFIYSPAFTITIPESLVLLEDEDYAGTMIITVENLLIPDSEQISISVSSLNEFDLVHVKYSSIRFHYKLTVDDSTDALSNGGTVSEVTQNLYDANGSPVFEIPINAKATETPNAAGVFEDVLTFTIKLDTI